MTRPTARLRAALPDLLLGLAVFVIHAISPSPQVGDSRMSVALAWQVLTHGNLHLEDVPAVRQLASTGDLIERGGHLVPFFPWPTMLLAAPGDVIAWLFGVDPSRLSISDPNLTWIIEVPTASLLVAITAVLIRHAVLGLHRLGDRWSSPRTAMIAALAFAFTTMAWSVGSRALWQQTLSMLLITAMVICAQRIGADGVAGARWPFWLGVLAGLSIIARPTNVVVVVLLGLWLLVARPRRAWLALIGGALVLAPFLLVSLREYGEVIPPYYLPTRLGPDSPERVYGLGESIALNLVSPSRGMLIYLPITLLAIVGVVMRIRMRRGQALDSAGLLDSVWALAVIGQFAVVAPFGSTHGFTYGPRLLMDTLPLIVLLAVPALASLRRPRRAAGATVIAASVAVAAVLGWGLFVNGTGALSRASVCWSATPVTIDEQPERVWDWSDPQFLRAWRDVGSGGPGFVTSCAS